MKRCPRCKLPMQDNDALNAVSLDGKTIICTMCAQIESLERAAPHIAEGLKISQRRLQAAIFGLDDKGNPRLPQGG